MDELDKENYNINAKNLENIDVSEIEEHITPEVSLFAKVESFDEETQLQESCFVGVIDISNPAAFRFNVESQNIP